MFDVAITFLGQLCDNLPYFIGMYICFDFIGTILFGRS